MISNEEIERYRSVALKRLVVGTIDEQNLSLMVIELVRVIDHLANCLIAPNNVVLEEMESEDALRKLRDQNAILSGALNESNRRQRELMGKGIPEGTCPMCKEPNGHHIGSCWMRGNRVAK